MIPASAPKVTSNSAIALLYFNADATSSILAPKQTETKRGLAARRLPDPLFTYVLFSLYFTVTFFPQFFFVNTIL